jgi:peptidoglycan/LPS O-acetylase OafA/YrhL
MSIAGGAGRMVQPLIRANPGASGFNRNLHGARGMLALAVLVFHVARCGLASFSWTAWAGPRAALISLQFGVELFFCISGFIVVGALTRARSPGGFLIDRAIRILPVLWASLAVVIPLLYLTHQGAFAGAGLRDPAWVLSINLVALAGLLPVPVLHMAAWSLSYEVAFYAVAAGLWWIPARQPALRFLVAAVAAVLVLVHPRALFFAVGVLVARVDFGRLPVLRHAIRAPGPLLAAFAGCWYVVQFAPGANGEEAAWTWLQSGTWAPACLAVCLAIVGVAGIVAGHGWLGVLLRGRLFQWLGGLSYHFYLWHLIVIAAAKRAFIAACLGAALGPWSQLALLVFVLPASLAVAQVSLLVVEQGTARLRQRWRAGAKRPAEGSLAGVIAAA